MVLKNTASDSHGILDKVKLQSSLWLKANLFTFAFGYHDGGITLYHT